MTPDEFRDLAASLVGDGTDNELAQACATLIHVSRQAVHNWISGANPVNRTAAALLQALVQAQRGAWMPADEPPDPPYVDLEVLTVDTSTSELRRRKGHMTIGGWWNEGNMYETTVAWRPISKGEPDDDT